MNEVNDPNVQSSVLQWGGGLVGAAMIIAVTVQKLMKGWSADKVERVSDDAQTDIVLGLRSELQRMRDQNSELAQELNKVQLAVARMAGENLRLHVEIEQLQAKIAQMIRKNSDLAGGPQ